MDGQFQREDWKIERVNENRFHIYVYDGTAWQYRYVADREGAANFVTDDLVSLGIDRYGNAYYRKQSRFRS